MMSPSRTPTAHHRNASTVSSGTNSFGNQSSSTNRRSGGIISSSDLLQTKLRSLLNTSLDHSQQEPLYKDGPSVHRSGKLKPDSQYELHAQYASPKKLSHQEVSVSLIKYKNQIFLNTNFRMFL